MPRLSAATRITLVLLLVSVPMLGFAPPAGATELRLPSVALVRSATDSLWSLLSGSHAPSPRVPVQRSGTPAGQPHHVPASASRAGRGAGSAPGRGAGQLPGYRVLPRKVPAGLSWHPAAAQRAKAGFNPKTSRLITAKSTRTSDLYQNADGSFSRRFGLGPVNFRDPAGAWRPIDTTLVHQAGGRWAEKANSIGVTFAASGDSPDLSTVVLGTGESASAGLAGAAPVKPTVAGPVITYPGVLPSTDLVAQPTALGMKESLVLHSASAPSSWVYPLNLTGLHPVLAADGSVSLLDANGKTAGVIPAAYAFDSKIDPESGEPATTHAVTYRLTTLNGAPALAVTLDPAWLSDPARVFPVTVDPSTLNTQSRTTYAESQNPGDHSMEQTIKVGSYDSGTHSAHSFLQFPGSGLDGSKVTVASASLSLFDVWASTCTAERFDVALVTTAWTPSGITAYPGPSYGSSIGHATPSVPTACANTGGDLSSGDNVTVSLSASALQGWADGTTPDYGLALYASTSDNLHWKQFGSLYDPAGPPLLTITYTNYLLPSVTTQYPADQFTANTLTPTLSAAGKIDSYLSGLPKFDFQVYSPSGTKIADSGKVAAGSNPGGASWTVPAGKLSWGESYYWYVRCYDGTNYSPSPVWNSISIQVPQPAVTSHLSQNTGGHGFGPSVGNYTTSATDAEVKTVGPSLSVVRDYNSLDPRTAGAFGAAWSSVFDARATEQDDSSGALASVTVTYPDGSQVGYGKNSDGSFSAPAGRFATLRSVTGGYTLTDKNDTVYSFTQSLGSGAYGISAITDSSKRSVNFTWASGEITTMTSAVSGRALHLTWASTGGAHNHVTSVQTDPAVPGTSASALTWSYTYTGDQLTGVCAPVDKAGHCTKYAYSAGSDYYSAMLDESPGFFWPLAESSGTTAADAVLENEGSGDATYSGVTLGKTGPLAGSSATAAGFNGSSSLVKLPNLALYSTDTESLSLWFKTSTAGGVILSAQDDPIAKSATQGNFEPVLYVGTDGKLNGLLWTQIAPSPVLSKSAVDDGKWHHVVLTGSPQAQTMWVDGVKAGTASGATALGITDSQPWLMANDYLGTGFIGAGWPDEPHSSSGTVYSDYFNGSIADVAYFPRALTQPDVTALYSAGTTGASLLSTITQPSGDVYAAVSYDPVTARVTNVTDENGGSWKLGTPSVSGSSDVYRTAVLGAGPQDYWRLGDGAGTAQAANEVHGGTAVYNSVTLGKSGPFADQTAASFDGTSSYITLPSGLVSSAGEQSISLWFKTTATDGVLLGSSTDPVTNSTTPGGYAPELYIGSDGYLRGEFWDNSTQPMASAGAVNDGKWHNVVLAASATAEALYLDGKQVGSVAKSVLGTGQDDVYIGAGFLGGGWADQAHQSSTDNTGYASFFSGSVAEVAYYGSELSGQQVAAAYEASRNSVGLAPVITVHLTDPGTHTISYEYDPLNGNREIAATDALGNKTSYGYDTGGFLHTVTDPDGNVTTTGHDPRGNTVSTTTCQDQATDKCSTVYRTYYPDDTSAVLSTADPRNDQVLTVRDGRSSSASDPAYETSYTYNTAGYVTKVTTPPVPGFPAGRATAITYSDGSATYPAADSGNVPAGLPVKIVSPGGATQTISYNHDGDIAKTVNADGLQTTYTYDGLGRVLTKTETSDTYSGLTTSYAYDGDNRVITQTDPTVTNRATGAQHTAQTSTVYTADGNISSQTVADLNGGDTSREVSYTYTPYGQVSSETDAAQAVTHFTYDSYGNKATETDANGNKTAYIYDADGHLTSTTLDNYTGDPVAPSAAVNLEESSRAYDPAGRLTSITDAMGNVTAYTYTDNGLLATITRSAPGGTSSYTEESDYYDAAGNLIKKVTNNGATTNLYTVDAADRISATTEDPSGADRTRTVSYTPDDQPAMVTIGGPGGASQVTSYTYDPMGNETSRSVSQVGSSAPTAWFPLASDASDAAAGGQPATAAGVTWTGSSASFAGTAGQQIATPGPAVDTTGSFTVAAWVNMAGSTGGDQVVAAQTAGTDSGFYLRYSQSSGQWEFTRPATDTTAPASWATAGGTTAAAGTWTFLAGTYDADTGTMTLYVNGAATSVTATDSTPFAAHGPLVIGNGTFDGAKNSAFDGQIADVQVYPRALCACAVSTLYSLGRGGGELNSGTVTTSWTLDQRGLPTSETGPDHNTTGYAYDEAGRLSAVTAPAVTAEPGGGAPVTIRPVTYYGYDTFGEQTEVKDPNGQTTTTAYDGDGHVTSQLLPPYTPPGGSVSITKPTLSTYDGDGNLKTVTDPLGYATQYTYDQLGDLSTVTAPDTGVTHYTYDTDGQRLSVTGPTGAQTQATYDFLGRQSTATTIERYPSAQSLVTHYNYDPSASDPGGAWLSSVQSPDGVVTGYGYDNLGEKTSVTDGAGDVTGYGYDFLGRQVTVTAPNQTQDKITYDELGDPVQDQQSNAGKVLTTHSATYDGGGRMLSATDARGNTTTFTYNAAGMLTQEVQPVSAGSAITTSFGYDAAGNQTRYTDGNGSDWLTTYNSWNLPESRVEPSTAAYSSAADSTFTTAYDADGRPVTMTEPGGVTVTDSYDKMGWLTGQSGTGADSATADRTFTYDQAGNMLTAATSAVSGSAATSESFTYNDRGAVWKAAGDAGSTTLGYNGDGLLSSRQDAAGTTSYTYDTADRLKTLVDPATGTTLTYGYNPDSQVNSIAYGSGGDTRALSYNALHQMTSDQLKAPDGTVIASIGYTYDSNGNLTGKTTAGLAGAAANTYTYDAANRLTSWDNGTATVAYSYDANGNRTQAGPAAYTYDARDELTSTGTSSYSYTARGTLSSVSGSSGATALTADAYGQQATDGTQAYTYDALGRAVTVTGSSGPALSLSYSGAGSLLASDGTSTYSWTPGGGLTGIGVAGGSASQGVLAMTDQHTDVVGQFTAAGSALSGSVAYGPLGKVLASSGSVAGRLGFQSAFTDPVSGKVLMGARWYDPAGGVFTSRDSVANSPVPASVDANPFAYGGDSPLLAVDPSGHFSFSGLWHSAASTFDSGRHWVAHTYDTARHWVAHTYDSARHAVASAADAAWNATIAAVNEELRQADAELAAIERETREINQEIQDLKARAVQTAARVVHTVTRVARPVYHDVVQEITAGYHHVRQAAKAGAAWVGAHKAAIASFAAGAAVFGACALATGGFGSLGCAAAAGAVGNLVSYGMSCGSAGGCSVAGALVSAGAGAVAGLAGGAVGGELAGALGGKLATTALGRLLPGFAVRGLEGLAVGAGSGAVAGAAGAGAGYAGNCAVSGGAGCSAGGFARAVAGGAAAGAAAGGVVGAAAGAAGLDLAPGCGGQSFTAGTGVLLASGKVEAISRLHAGQKVLAADTKTGKNQPETVAAVLVHHDKDLYDLKVREHGHTAVIHTTSNHLFWVPGSGGHGGGRWVKAGALRHGTHLRTPAGRGATVTSGQTPRQHDGWMWDLTIPGNNDHDFYVEPTSNGTLYRGDRNGVTPVLVHNIDGIGCGLGSGPQSGIIKLSEDVPSTGALDNFRAKAITAADNAGRRGRDVQEGGRDFIYDPVNRFLAVSGKRFTLGHPGLVAATGADEAATVGGELVGGPDPGTFLTDERSGHYPGWTDETRQSFLGFMSSFGYSVDHSPTWGRFH